MNRTASNDHDDNGDDGDDLYDIHGDGSDEYSLKVRGVDFSHERFVVSG